MFRDGVAARRGVVPATGLYEWDADKRRYLFRMPARTELYMAALYGVFGGEANFFCQIIIQAVLQKLYPVMAICGITCCKA